MPSKALLVGVNYFMNKDKLLSPINNVEILNDFLISYNGVSEENVKILSDSPTYENATFFNITSSLKKIISSSDKNDFIFLYFSGYGNFLGEFEKGSDNYEKERMKMKSLYRKKNENTLFLPEDYNMASLTIDYFYKILNLSNSRIFLFFDCYNKNNTMKLKNYYDINKNTFNTFLENTEKKISNLIVLSSNSTEKQTFNKFSKINIINNKINKTYSIFLLDLIQYLFNYIQMNINFNTFSYKDMYKIILKINTEINKLNFSSLKESEREQMNKGCCGDKQNNNILLSFSEEKLIDANFFENISNEITTEEKTSDDINEKMLQRDKTIAFKNIKLERELKITQKRLNHIIKQYEELYKKYRNNFNLLL